MHQRAKIHQNLSAYCKIIARFLIFQDGGFQDGSRSPSWSCLGLIWITHEEHLVVFILLHNLIAIDAVVLII